MQTPTTKGFAGLVDGWLLLAGGLVPHRADLIIQRFDIVEREVPDEFRGVWAFEVVGPAGNECLSNIVAWFDGDDVAVLAVGVERW